MDGLCYECDMELDEDNYIELHPYSFCCESCLEAFLERNPHLAPTCMDESAEYYGSPGWNRERD